VLDGERTVEGIIDRMIVFQRRPKSGVCHRHGGSQGKG
jgi:hypothetical protein